MKKEIGSKNTLDIETLGEVFRRDSFLYAGYRGIYARRNKKGVPEDDTVPLLGSVLFIPAILGYLIYKRLRMFFGSTPEIPNNTQQLVSITSTDGYRSYSLIQVAKQLQKEGVAVTLLCSPSAEGRIDDWRAVAPTVRHADLHGLISVPQVLSILYQGLRTTVQLRSLLNDEGSLGEFVLAHNLIILELIKFHSIQPLTDNDPVIHTLKPMPYFTESTTEDNVYVYQHGTPVVNGWEWPGIDEQPPFDLIASIPYFIPLTYFVWGEPWKQSVEIFAHPESQILATGSPWYDRLADRRSESVDKDVDVLFISQSHALDDDSRPAYRQLIDTVVNHCQANNLTLAIKLHPRESDDWYQSLGYDQFVTEFGDIDDALLRSRVAVTDTSTAFVEASVLGTPTIVVDLPNTGLKKLEPVSNVRFVRDLNNISKELDEAINDRMLVETEAEPLVNVRESVQRVLKRVY